MKNLAWMLSGLAVSVIAASGGCSGDILGGTSNCENAKQSKTASAGSDVACSIAKDGPEYGTTFENQSCIALCGDGYSCTLPAEYLPPDAGADAGAFVCPPSQGQVTVTCNALPCLGRLTDGAVPDAITTMTPGEYFAASAQLEEIAVFAFERIAAELELHGAPRALVDAANVARADEERHTRMTSDIARRFGVEPVRATRPEFAPRSLFALARENAAEGCVRETYGAVFALIHAHRTSDPTLRAELLAIANDECAHAELSWNIASWAEPLLTNEERAALTSEKRIAVRELARDCVSSDWRDLPTSADRQLALALLDAKLFAA